MTQKVCWFRSKRADSAESALFGFPLKQALAEIAPSDPSPNFVNRSRQYQAVTTELESGNSLQYRSMTVTGEIYDAFDLVKADKTVLIEKTPPDTPEYRFSE